MHFCTNAVHGMDQSDTLVKACSVSPVASVSSQTELALLCRSEMIDMKAGSEVMSSDAWPKASLAESPLNTCSQEEWWRKQGAVQMDKTTACQA